jgi:hypothetical protein
MWRNILAALTTQQVLSFIQYKIAETHAAGEDIVSLLSNPEIAFSLQVLEGTYDNLMQAPAMAVAANNTNINQDLEWLSMAASSSAIFGSNQTSILLF